MTLTIKNNTPMKMCILGGGGYFGQSLAKALQNNGHFVILLDLTFLSFPHIKLDPLKLKKIEGSILDCGSLREALRGCNVCFHLAGYGMTGGASLNRKMNWRINFEGTKLIIDECKKLGVERLLYASSVSVVYDGNDFYFADETMPYSKNFANPYAESKCYAEKALLAANNQITKIDCKSVTLVTCALRFRGIYGPGELRTIQRTINLLLNGMVMAKFRRRKNGECYTQYSNIENCVNGFILAEESLRKKNSPACGQAYNIVDGGKPVDTFGFWEPLIKGVGAKVPKIYIPYSIIYFVAYIFELLYFMTGIEPLFTRFEAHLMAINNTFSIEKAKREIGYNPINNHNLTLTICFFKQQQQQQQKQQQLNIGFIKNNNNKPNQFKMITTKLEKFFLTKLKVIDLLPAIIFLILLFGLIIIFCFL